MHDSLKRAVRQYIRKTRDELTRLETLIGDSSDEFPALAETAPFSHFRIALDEFLRSRTGRGIGEVTLADCYFIGRQAFLQTRGIGEGYIAELDGRMKEIGIPGWF